VQAEGKVAALLKRNKECLSILVERLREEPWQLLGDDVRALVLQHANPEDLKVVEMAGADVL
jgi:hypothetical protein